MANKQHKRVVKAQQEQSTDMAHQHNKNTGRNVGKAGLAVSKTLFRSIGKILLTVFLVLIIITSIVGTAMTVFVMNYIESEGLDLSNAEIFSNSFIYGKNKDSEDVVVQKLKTGGRREWVPIEKIPQHVQDAFVYTEDMRFMDHEGVDWKRTVVSFARMMLSGDNSQGGGSTISQQLIKNINGDFENEKRKPETKVKEILGALQLERHNSKSTVLEAYLNYINLGLGNFGIQAASKFYFNKDVSELTIAEGAALAATTKSPNNINVKTSPEGNKDRRNNYTLDQMYRFDRITTQEFEDAKKEKVKAYDWGDKNPLEQEGESTIYNWYVDNTVRQVLDDLQANNPDMSKNQAWSLINGGGLQIYTSVNVEMQDYLEEFFLNDKNFWPNKVSPHPPEGAMTIMDYNGYVQATVGSRNEKTASLTMDRATQDPRSPGSTMKPIAAYALGIDTDLVTWSSLIKDEPKVKMGGNSTPNWPKNYDRKYRGMVSVADALKVSLNTVPVDIAQQLGIDRSYNFLKDDLGISTLGDQNDRYYNMILGMNDKGLYLDELCAAYTIFGNNGRYNAPKYYTKVLDMDGKVLLDNEPENTAAISADSAYVMNQLLQQVVNGSGGATGTAARLDNGITVAGKTGTSDGSYERSFVGLTPYYVAAIRFGYDQDDKKVTGSKRSITNKVHKPQEVWRKVMQQVLKGYEKKDFDDTLDKSGVVSRSYCVQTGLLAGATCSHQAMGWYKTSNLPATCSLNHGGSRNTTPQQQESDLQNQYNPE